MCSNGRRSRSELTDKENFRQRFEEANPTLRDLFCRPRQLPETPTSRRVANDVNLLRLPPADRLRAPLRIEPCGNHRTESIHIGWTTRFILDGGSDGDPSGTGLAALIDHPDEFSGGCAAPCGGTLGHDGWLARSWPSLPAAAAPCGGLTARSVAAVKGDDAAAYLAAVMQDALSHGEAPDAKAAAAFRMVC
ncbi:hypothetical protein THAOC_30103 [Thalassiosira oceanica]|uniref:Uncharacterized protein n=1 Tax=Thalassiosira oceanica TaxID=159749 RepID=K0RPI2_THAOC|nr:hypothetical protein THAOC_30103 [Thalassiosira oceanica]|eukprot:EJK50796.1 hypothetical protein THAOC_30103 [Thalassiosira oceanica]